MKQITIKVTIALCAFIIGIIVTAAYFVNPAPKAFDISLIESKVEIPMPLTPTTTPDSTIYSVNFCELMQNPKLYEGKIVSTQTYFFRGIDVVFLEDKKCKGVVTPYCSNENVQCGDMWIRLRFGDKVDLIGRYNADVNDPRLFGDPEVRVNAFEILEWRTVKSVKLRKRIQN